MEPIGITSDGRNRLWKKGDTLILEDLKTKKVYKAESPPKNVLKKSRSKSVSKKQKSKSKNKKLSKLAKNRPRNKLGQFLPRSRK